MLSLEPIGIFVIIIGFLMVFSPLYMAATMFALVCMFGAAAAITLPALRGSTIMPGSLMLGFFVVLILLRARREFPGQTFATRGFEVLDVGAPGFWFMVTALWALFGAYVMPRLLEGVTSIYVTERSVTAFGEATAQLVLRPLSPTSGNFTQGVYFFADFICFVAASLYARIPGGWRWLGYAILATCIANIFFGALDLVTYWTGTSEYLSFMRNSTYSLLDDTEIDGLKRVVGSFTEASVFAGASVVCFAFTLQLWLRNVLPWVTGSTMIASLIFVIISTSSTGYVSLLLYSVFFYFYIVVEIFRGPVSRNTVLSLFAAPVLLFVIFLFLWFNDSAMDAVQSMIDKTLSSEKLVSQSGIQRGEWNAQAIRNLLDTWGLGIGIGSTRASSVIVVSLASLGIPGTITYFIFMFQIITRPYRPGTLRGAYRYAARHACLANIIPALVSGGHVGMGLMFAMTAALACAPETSSSAIRSKEASYVLPEAVLEEI